MNNIISITTKKYYLHAVFAIILLAFLFPIMALASPEDNPITPISWTSGNFVVVNDSTVKVMGRVDTGSDVSAEVWFEWGTNSSSLNNRTSTQVVTGHTNIFDYILNLNANTKYYYRVVVRNTYTTSYSDTVPFIIGDNALPTPPEGENNQTTTQTTYTYTYTSGSTARPIALTRLPNSVLTTSVNLVGLALPGGNISTDGWFEWGTTSALGKQTVRKNIGSSSSINFSEILSGLSPNTVYYYRAVIQNQRGVSSGNILSFRTKSVPAPVVSEQTKPTVAPQKPQKEEKPEQKDDEVTDDQTATSLFAGGMFFPDTLLEWLLLVILILIIFALSNHLYGVHQKREKEKKEELAKANLE